jgi:diadenosine tetraphosphate (Ap4A) HIT family hydrolase
MPFTLHPQIEADSIFICDLPLCQVRLENVRNFPWLILIPRIDGATEVHQLSTDQQTQLISESSQCAQALMANFDLHKINVGALGNVVPQLHWHVVGRRNDDDAWPKPVWGFSDTDPWTACEIANIRTLLIKQVNNLSTRIN